MFEVGVGTRGVIVARGTESPATVAGPGNLNIYFHIFHQNIRLCSEKKKNTSRNMITSSNWSRCRRLSQTYNQIVSINNLFL